jgi:hypothetical protein
MRVETEATVLAVKGVTWNGLPLGLVDCGLDGQQDGPTDRGTTNVDTKQELYY